MAANDRIVGAGQEQIKIDQQKIQVKCRTFADFPLNPLQKWAIAKQARG